MTRKYKGNLVSLSGWTHTRHGSRKHLVPLDSLGGQAKRGRPRKLITKKMVKDLFRPMTNEESNFYEAIERVGLTVDDYTWYKRKRNTNKPIQPELNEIEASLIKRTKLFSWLFMGFVIIVISALTTGISTTFFVMSCLLFFGGRNLLDNPQAKYKRDMKKYERKLVEYERWHDINKRINRAGIM